MHRRAIAGGMRPNRHPLDEDSATRMLGGVVHPDDAPPGFGSVAALLAAASALPEVDEDAAGATVSAMVEAIRTAPAPQTVRRTSMLKKLLAGKALAAIGVVALTASGAAAATGSLPDPAQTAVSGAASHVGIHLPDAANHGKSAGHRQDGLHRPDDTTSTTAGSDDPSGDNHGSLVSDTAHNAQDGTGKVGPTVCAVASDGKCKAGADHTNQGKHGSDDGTTSSTAGSGDDHGQSGDHGQAGDDHGAPTTVTTGSLATGENNSGKNLSTTDEGDSASGGRH